MIRHKFKALGLALLAVVAVSALGASAAQAEPQYTCSTYGCTATGSNTKGSEVFTTEAGKVECDSHFLVEKLNGKNEDIPAATSTVTVTPTYTGCEAFGFLSATVTTTGCDYVFTATEKVSATVYRHHVNVVCEAGKSIKISAAGGLCQAEIKAQNELTTVDTTNISEGGVGKLTVEPTVNGVAYTVTNDGFGCPFNGTGNKTDGKYTGHVIISRVGGGSISVSGE
jgi:hypothetical protein